MIKFRIRGILIYTVFLFGMYIPLAGQNLVVNSDMEQADAWTIYHMGSENHANYEFGYTDDGPLYGSGGCLRVTSDKATNILFWQSLTMEAGKTYEIDAAVKTGYVESFWLELYLSTVFPQPDEDYSPNNNDDRELGLSTWEGCGPDEDGLMSEISCLGDNSYTVPGTGGENVDICFGIKTGIWNDMEMIEVLIDSVTVKLVEDWYLLGTEDGILDHENKKITNVAPVLSVADFYDGLETSATASVQIIGVSSGNSIPVSPDALISDTMLVRVSGNLEQDYEIELRPVGTGNDILYALGSTINNTDSTVTDLPGNATVLQLITSIEVSPYATYEVLTSDDQTPENTDTISGDLKIVVLAENGDDKIFSLETGNDMAVKLIADSTGTIPFIKDEIIELEGSINWHITREDNPLQGSILNLKSDDIWIYFDSIRPQQFYDAYIDLIRINNEELEPGVNARLVQYAIGCVLVSHPENYMPLEIFSEEDLGGTSMELGLYTYNRSTELGGMEDNIRSLRLNKGYMATLARDTKGTGYSRVFIADEDDIIVDSLPDGLYDAVSFIRVIPWRWTTKKGRAGSWDDTGHEISSSLNCSWDYDWDNVRVSGLNVEYVPMRHNPNWNAYSNINSKKNSTHALHFNEPDNEVDDGYSTVQGAIDQWPEMLESGLRLGSPAPTDGGREWLYDFIKECDKLNYRVDFVAIHWYWGCSNPQAMYDFLKNVHDNTGRPVWITEWNNGANWTGCLPTYEEQAEKIGEFIYMLDTTSFVERYSIYEWVEAERELFYPNGKLTPAGIVYRDNASPMAFSHENEFYIDYTPLPNAIASADIDQANVIAYPQPVSDVLFLKGLKKPETVNIYNITGNRVHSVITNGKVNTEHLPDGIYIIIIDGHRPVKISKMQ